MDTAARTGRLMTMRAQPGRGAELADTLLRVAEGLRGFPGCELYVISRDHAEPDTVRVTEVWSDEEAVQAALAATPADSSRPSISDVLAMLAGPPERVDVVPLGGVGLPAGTDPVDRRAR
ncbi:antibiotic biosynthesis monooxygenase family protein [Micromonospora soli]|uniref:putative quinol monooxygenase n=1 Tax=Micromonospora sp. NBRC 110009 TaxID=3061627 RepID=UPI0026733047|nr:antibiotic biosynthesis monooxygenase family protein [Micromonospora sp. NBRC 110009]WKT98011.1 antibiotic biosynthesis monooxygenase family protein [Micromonospora sp. NBRC 110009]